MKAISVKNLTYRYSDVTAVDHIDLDVECGEIFGFIGSNGAGKTTTIRMLSTLLTPSEGSAEIMGYDLVKEADKVRKQIALVAQKPYALDWFLSTEKNIKFYMQFNGVKDAQLIKETTKQIMKDFGLEDNKEKQVYRLSGGNQRRVMVGRAFACKKPLIFLDEPTVGLDPYARHKTWEYIKKANTENNQTIFLTSHDMNEIEALCHRIALIKDGKIVAVDSPQNIRAVTGEKVINVTYDGEVYNLFESESEMKILKKENGMLAIGTNNVDGAFRKIMTIQSDNFKISSINVTEPSLEDFFLKLVGGDVA